MKLPLLNNLHYSKRALVGGFVLVGFLLSYWYWLDYRDFLKTTINFGKEPIIFQVEKGVGINKLAMQLTKNGVIEKPNYLKLLAYLQPELSKLRAGEYQLQGAMTPREMLLLFNQGKVIQYSFTIIEGQTYWEVLANLDKAPKLVPLSENESQQLVKLLGINVDLAKGNTSNITNSIEGWLLPETYSYSKGESAISVLRRASQAMQQVLQKHWQLRAEDLPLKTPYEALILASIIEKETGIASERAEIAGVFARRLRKNMRLQTDPTVIYGIRDSFNGDITRKDLKTPTPYNTYVIKGLPPTPIAMPSEKAIIAALNPSDGKSLYFVADGTGGHYFSETLAEHQKAVIRMLKRNRQR